MIFYQVEWTRKQSSEQVPIVGTDRRLPQRSLVPKEVALVLEKNSFSRVPAILFLDVDGRIRNTPS